MERYGFRYLDEEWWHYTLIAESFPDTYFDFDIIWFIIQMERSERTLEKSIIDMMQVETLVDEQDPIVGELSQVIYSN